jgi:carbon-monoxide dehydrogenase large subunit
MVGHSVAAATREVRAQILLHASAMLECAVEDLEIRPGGHVGVRGVPGKNITFGEIAARAVWESGGEIAGGHRWLYRPIDADPKRASGEGYAVGTNVFGAQVVEVEVDADTGRIDVLNAWSAHDVGRAINPREVAAQIEGGFVQGLGYALTEELLWDEGRLVNPSFMDYKIPGALDAPRRMQAIVVEMPDPRGPFGAKGIGEPPLVGVAPAIGNAVYNATGVRLTEIPMTPERVLAALEAVCTDIS